MINSTFTEPPNLPASDNPTDAAQLELLRDPMVDHPAHYNLGEIECIDALEACSTPEEFGGWLRLSAMKYLWRLRHKNGARDLHKAKWYLDRYAQFLKYHPSLGSPTTSKITDTQLTMFPEPTADDARG